MKYSRIPRAYTHVISKLPFFLIKTMELQIFVFRNKDLRLIYICDKLFFKKYIYTSKVIYK